MNTETRTAWYLPPDEFANGTNRYRRPDSAFRSQFFRPSSRPGHTFLHRDVGALQLLWHACAAHALHDAPAHERRVGFFRHEGWGDLWLLHRDSLSAESARRMVCGPHRWAAKSSSFWRNSNRSWRLLPRLAGHRDVL